MLVLVLVLVWQQLSVQQAQIATEGLPGLTAAHEILERPHQMLINMLACAGIARKAMNDEIRQYHLQQLDIAIDHVRRVIRIILLVGSHEYDPIRPAYAPTVHEICGPFARRTN